MNIPRTRTNLSKSEIEDLSSENKNKIIERLQKREASLFSVISKLKAKKSVSVKMTDHYKKINELLTIDVDSTESDILDKISHLREYNVSKEILDRLNESVTLQYDKVEDVFNEKVKTVVTRLNSISKNLGVNRNATLKLYVEAIEKTKVRNYFIEPFNVGESGKLSEDHINLLQNISKLYFKSNGL